ncbi:MAG: hypothetical protein HN744_07885 [Halieaceae bacterium]|nr:hypothetical protein [Halieaceae bacterium]MBT7719302.1 hypothetical protein [Halieaceae bacterium]
MPMMSMLALPSFERIDRAVENGNEKAHDLVSYWVGQGVGLVGSVKSCRTIMHEFKEEFGEAVISMNDVLGI